MSRYPGFEYDTITKRGFFDCYVPGSAGTKRRRRTVPAETRTKALALWRAFVAELAEEAGGMVTNSKSEPADVITIAAATPVRVPTLREFVTTYYVPTIRAALKKRTQASYDSIITRRLLPALGDLPLDTITAVVVTDFKVALRNTTFMPGGNKPPRRYAPSYINDCVRVLKMLLHQAVAREVLPAFPIKQKVAKEKEPILRLELTDVERHAFLAVFEDFDGFAAHLATTQKKGKVVRSARFGGKPRRFGGGMRSDSDAARRYFARFQWMRPLFLFALETGVRRGDILKLTWESIDMVAGWIRVTMEKTEFEAIIPISRACRAALDECRRRAPNSALVFVDEAGRAISETRVRRTYALAKTLAGITRRCRFHDLRHTFASRLVSSRNGVNLRVVATALGHTTTEQTERYAKPSEVAMRQILTALDADTRFAPTATHSAA